MGLYTPISFGLLAHLLLRRWDRSPNGHNHPYRTMPVGKGEPLEPDFVTYSSAFFTQLAQGRDGSDGSQRGGIQVHGTAIYAYIDHQNHPNVGIDGIHGVFGCMLFLLKHGAVQHGATTARTEEYEREFGVRRLPLTRQVSDSYSQLHIFGL